MPCRKTITARTADQSGRIKVPIYEGGRLRGEIKLENLNTSLPEGTRVDITIVVKNNLDLIGRVVVGADDHKEGRVEIKLETLSLPPLEEMRGRFEDLREAFDLAMEVLQDPIEKLKPQQRGRDLIRNIERELAHHLPTRPKIAFLLEDLEYHIKKINETKVLKPSLEEFQGKVKKALELDKNKKYTKNIEVLLEEGDKAYISGDEKQWHMVDQRIDDIIEEVSKEGNGAPPPPEILAPLLKLDMLNQVWELSKQVQQLGVERQYAGRLEDLKRKVAAVDVETNPIDALRKIIFLHQNEFQSLSDAIAPTMEKGGLVLETEVISREIESVLHSEPPVTKHYSLAKKPQPFLDENVQFTVYRPRLVAPEIWYPLVAFAHLAELPPDAPPEEVDPVEEVKRQAKQVLADKYPQYQELVQDSVQGIPREGELTFLPEIPGCEFNPPRRTFLWQESVHREEFRMRAPKELDGQTIRGRLSVFLGCILVAEVPLSIKVNRQEALKTPKLPIGSASVKAYRNIFASYSHKDIAIVNAFEQNLMSVGLGDKYLRDLVDLRVGEEWSPRLMEMIREANIFQLFWSRNSMVSPFVEQEWRYALSLQRPYFVRPAYWEEPLPELPEKNLPPEELRRLHFVRVYPRGTPAASPVQSDEITIDGKRVLSPSIGSTLKLWGLERGEEPPAEKTYRTSSPVASSPIKMPPVTLEPPSPLWGEYPFKQTRKSTGPLLLWAAVLVAAILLIILLYWYFAGSGHSGQARVLGHRINQAYLASCYAGSQKCLRHGSYHHDWRSIVQP